MGRLAQLFFLTKRGGRQRRRGRRGGFTRHIALMKSLVHSSVSAKDFRPYSKIASEPMGVGALQSKHRFRLRSGRNQKRFLAVFDGFRSPRISFPRVGARGGCARPAQRPPRLCAPFCVCPSRQNNKRQPMEGPLMAIKGSLRADADSKKSLRSLARNQSHRAEPMHRASQTHWTPLHNFYTVESHCLWAGWPNCFF